MDKDKSALGMPSAEINALFECMTYASRPLRDTARNLTQLHSLGPRGVHILAVIDGGANFPIEIAKTFDVSRSLITAELNRLLEAALIHMRPSAEDRRRTNVILTDKGRCVLSEMRKEVQRLFETSMGDFSREEVLTCIRVLNAFRANASTDMTLGAPRIVKEAADRHRS